MWALSSCVSCGRPIDLGSRTKRKKYCDMCKKIRQRQGVQAFVKRKKLAGQAISNNPPSLATFT